MSISRTLFLSVLMVSSVGIVANDPASSGTPGLEKIRVGLISGVGSNLVALTYLPINFIDWFGEKLFIQNGIEKFAALAYLKDSRLGSWLAKHNQGLSRAVMVAVVGSAIYYCWKKNQESKKAQDRELRIVDDGGTEDFGYFGDTESFETEDNDDNLV